MSVFLPGESPWTKEPGSLQSEVTKSGMTERLTLHQVLQFVRRPQGTLLVLLTLEANEASVHEFHRPVTNRKTALQRLASLTPGHRTVRPLYVNLQVAHFQRREHASSC